MNRKGDATDIVFFGIIIFFLAVSFVVVLFVNDKISTIISTTALNQSAAADDIIDGIGNINSTVTQRGFTLMFAIFILGLMVSAFLVRVHPIFLFIYIFTLIMAVLDAVYLTNLYNKLTENAQLSALAANYTQITWIMEHAVVILIVVGALSMIITFSKIFSTPVGSSGGDL